MNLVTAIIIDDETHNRNVLNTLLGKYCSNIKIISEASGADEAFEKIVKLRPQLVFLDIQMPNKSGFELLRMFSEFNFEVIFVTAFNEYAVTAFEFNALGYILKPIDYTKLVNAVDKAIFKINFNEKNNNIIHFVNTLDEKSDKLNKISIHHNDKVIFLHISDIVSVEANSGICEIKTINNQHYYSSKELKLFDQVFEKFGGFIRISKSHIINSYYIKSYSKRDICVIEMINGSEFQVSRRKKSEIIHKINQ